MRHKVRLGLFLEEYRIISTHTEDAHRTRVAEHRIAHLCRSTLSELPDVLMRNDQVQTIFARLREDVSE